MPLDGQVASMQAAVLYNGALQALMLGRPVTALACFQVRPPERAQAFVGATDAPAMRCPAAALHRWHRRSG